MPLMKAEEHVESSPYLKIDNRKCRKLLRDANLAIEKDERQIASKHIPRDRIFERIQIMCRLRDKLDAKTMKTQN